ncbi:MAG: hypothetical protein QM533_05200 [Cytophagales bacterium]|nr:hypothetical protein [Cytophagales bacterium]
MKSVTSIPSVLRLSVIAAAACTSVLLVGCASSLKGAELRTLNENTQINLRAQQAEQNRINVQQSPLVMRVKTPYLGNRDSELSPDTELPAYFKESFLSMGENMPKTSTLSGWAQTVNRLFGVRVRIMPEVFLPASTLIAGNAARGGTTNLAAIPGQTGGAPGGTPPPSNPALASIGQSAAAARDFETSVEIEIKENLLDSADAIASRIGASYRYDHASKELVFYRFDTKTFTLRASPGTYTFNNTVGSTATASTAATSSSSSSGSANSATASSASTGLNGTFNVWDATLSSIGSMMTGGRQPVGNPGTGTITVTDTVESLKKIERYLDGQNRILNRKALVRVQYFRITVNRASSFGMGADLVYSKLIDANPERTLKFGSGSSLLASGAGSASFNILRGRLNGSSINLGFLNELGSTSDTYDQDVPLMNFRQQSISAYRNKGYLSRTTPGAGGAAGGTGVPGLETAVAPSGTFIFMHPSIYEGGEIGLRLSFNRSTVPQFDAITTGSGLTQQQVQLIDQSGISLTPELSMRSGETLVMVGVSQDGNSEGSRSGLLSLSDASSKTQELQVILITPRLDGSSSN